METSNGSRYGQVEGEQRVRAHIKGCCAFQPQGDRSLLGDKVKSDFIFNARLVVQGWSRRRGIDHGATFPPVCRIEM